VDEATLHVNVDLIPYNPTGMFEGSSREAVERFKTGLGRARIPGTVRLTRGRDIEGACGQIAAAPRDRVAATT
jgi:23S rRNA (adenine2503-C2)-methyltransferase